MNLIKIPTRTGIEHIPIDKIVYITEVKKCKPDYEWQKIEIEELQPEVKVSFFKIWWELIKRNALLDDINSITGDKKLVEIPNDNYFFIIVDTNGYGHEAIYESQERATVEHNSLIHLLGGYV